MKCMNCQSDNREGVKFCEECGTCIAVECPACIARIPLDKKFCGECGSRLPEQPESPAAAGVDYSRPDSYTPKFMAEKILTTRSSVEGERKLVTVFFCDVTGFTALSEGLDPEAVHQIMDGCFKILMEEIHRYEGTINQFTGDGVMALFGAPLAHEDHAQRACSAALGVQGALVDYSRQVKQDFGVAFKMRIGLNSGPVVVGAIGDDLRMDYTAVGDTTNLAARMESLAEPGTVQISESTFRQVRTYFDCDSLGPVAVKGKQAPQPAYRLTRARRVKSRLEASREKGFVPYIGRQEEMADLARVFARVSRGRGQVAGIVGEAGIGKSRFIFEVRNQLPPDALWLETRCLQYKASIPFVPVLDLVTGWCRMEKSDPEPVRIKSLTQGLEALDPELLSCLPAFRHLLTLPGEDPEWEALDPREKRDKTFEVLGRLFLRLSRNAPLVVTVDDIQWMDKTSEAFLHHLIGRIPNARILLVLIYRQEYEHGWGSRSLYNQIAIPPLSRDESLQFLKAVLKTQTISGEIRELIYSRTSGNPLFMEELCTTLIEDKTIVPEEEGWQVRGNGGDPHIPDTLQGIIAGRMDRLGDNAKTTMQLASVIGRTFGFRLLRNLTGMGGSVRAHLARLAALEFISENPLSPELEYIFKNIITREVAYNSLLNNQRREIHGRIGLVLEEMYPDRREAFYEVLAFHFSNSDIKDKAAHYLRASGDKAMGNYAAFEAFEFYRQALETLKARGERSNQARIEVFHAIIAPMIILNFPKGCLGLIREGIALARALKDEPSLIRFYSNTGYLHLVRGERHKGMEFSEKAFDRAVQTNDITAMAQTSPDLCLANMSAGRYDRVIDIIDLMRHALEREGREADTFGGPAMVYPSFISMSGYSRGMLGDFDRGEAECRDGLARAEAAGHLFTTSICRYHTGDLFLARGKWAEAAKVMKQALKEMAGIRLTQLQAGAKAGLGLALAYTGAPKQGMALCREALHLFKAEGIRWEISNLLLLQAICAHKADRPESARSLADQARASAAQSSEPCFRARALLWSGRFAGPSGGRGEKQIREGLEILAGLGMKPDMALARLFLGEIYLASGRRTLARDSLSQAEAMFAAMGMGFWRQQAADLISGV